MVWVTETAVSVAATEMAGATLVTGGVVSGTADVTTVRVGVIFVCQDKVVALYASPDMRM